MATISEYVTSNGFNKNIFLEGKEEIDMSKFGKGFFPGNEILNPPILEDEEEGSVLPPADEGEANPSTM